MNTLTRLACKVGIHRHHTLELTCAMEPPLRARVCFRCGHTIEEN